jgi:hypothetical protein
MAPLNESSKFLDESFFLDVVAGGDVVLLILAAFLTSVGDDCVIEEVVAMSLLAFTFTRGVG